MEDFRNSKAQRKPNRNRLVATENHKNCVTKWHLPAIFVLRQQTGTYPRCSTKCNPPKLPVHLDNEMNKSTFLFRNSINRIPTIL